MADDTAVLDAEPQLSDSAPVDSQLDSTQADSQPADFGQMLDSESGAGGADNPASSSFDAALDTATSPAAQDLRGILSQQGFKLDGVDDTQLANYVVQTAQQAAAAQQYQQQLAQYQQQLAEAQQYAQYGRQVAPVYSQFQQWMAQQQTAPAQPAAPTAPKHPTLKPQPEFDQALMQLVQEDPQTGRYVPINMHVPPDVAQKVNAYHDWRREAANHLLDNYVPPEQLREELLQEARQMFQQEFEQRQAQQQQVQYVSQTINELGPLVYQHDQSGQVVRDFNGRPQLNDTGYAYANYVQQLEQNGVTDPRAQDQLARQMLQGHLAQQRAVAPQQQAAPVDPKQAFVQRPTPTRRPNQTASVLRADQSPSVAQNPLLSFEQMLDTEAKRQGLTFAR